MPSQSLRISRYEIKSAIGGGGMGRLYLARDPNTGRLVALKLLRASLDSGDLRTRFAREAQALAALSHPNIVTMFDSGEFRGAPFIVMEYVRGETLAEKIKRHAPMSLGQKLKIAVELCSGLAHAHDAGIVHRDVKPANLMVDQHGRLKIVDFGIARVAEGLTRAGLEMTQAHMQIGTPGYMAPEQIEGGEIDQRADIFAAGAVLYELLCYREAFTGHSTRQIERRVLESTPAPLASLVPDVDPAIAAIVDRALEKDPDRRYQSADELEAAVEQQRARLGAAATPVPPSRPTPAPGLPGRVRESRAEAAYQRCLAVYGEGALETARRFAIEALAEDPAHAGALELLRKLEPHGPEVAAFAGASAVVAAPATYVGGTPSPYGSGMRDEGTVLAGLPTFAGSHEDVRSSWPLPSQPTQAVSRPLRWRALLPLHVVWPRYAWPAAAATAVAVAIAVTFALIRSPSQSSQHLTVLRPSGGTIVAAGITCGTGGADCTATLGESDTLDFRAEPDEGFTFVGFTGDCAPGGHVIMSAARSCGATFIPSEGGTGTSEPMLLTIAPPSGGSIVGAGIACGSLGAECSVKHARGTPVTLEPLADAGFAFRGFTGDCAPRGNTQMDGPRTCGATFARLGKPSADDDDAAANVPPLGPGKGARDEAADTAERSSGGSPSRAKEGAAAAEGSNGKGATAGDARAQGAIQRALDRYRTAYEDLDFQAIRSVFPTAPEAIRGQLRQYKSLQYTFTGKPEFVDVDAKAGVATVEVGIKQVFRARVGGQQPPNESRVRFKMFRRGDSWLIDQTTFLDR